LNLHGFRVSLLVVSVPDQEEPSEDTARPLQATALIVLSVVGSGANILVATVFHRRPALRSPSNRSVSQTVVINLKYQIRLVKFPLKI
jgi:hypothetical protein